LVYFEKTPATKSEFYFELNDGRVCFLSDDGIFFFSVLPNFVRKAIVYTPFLIALALLVPFELIEFAGVVTSWATPGLLFVLTWVFLAVPYVTGKILSYRRSKKFSGRSLEDLLNSRDQKYLRSRRDWAEVGRVELRHYNVTLKWNSSLFPFITRPRMNFVWNYYPQLKSFLQAKVDGRLVEMV